MIAPTPVGEGSPRILIVDDDRNSRESLGRALARDGFRVQTAEDGRAALALARAEEFDLVVTDLIMPGLSGLDFLEGLRVVRPDVPAILISAFAKVDTAVKAVQRGVSDVLEKPIRLRDVRKAIKRAMEGRRALGDAPRLRVLPPVAAPAPRAPEAPRGDDPPTARPAPRRAGPRVLIGHSPAFRELLDLVERVAPAHSTALLLGESGTGKELVAHALHAGSPRARGPLIKVACAALSEGVLEAELFGHEKGAFTGAHVERRGRFELADGGTLFLDEIAELSAPLQVKLLRVLQEGEFERVGGGETLRVDVRVVAATNRDLEAEVRAGRFRPDLYYRLAVIPIPVPPLRARAEDIPALAEHFLAKSLQQAGRTRPACIEPAAMACLCAYRWPGNVRELENAVERAVVLCRGESVRLEDLPEAVRRSVADPALEPRPVVRFEVGHTLEMLEREAIQRTLEAVAGNREAAASLLGIGVATLYRRLREAEGGPGMGGGDTEPAL